MTSVDLDALGAVDTPTICNAIEVVRGGRTVDGYTRQPVVALDPALPPVVGYAVTATISAAAPPEDAAAATQMRLAYYRALADAVSSGPTVVVIEDTDEQVLGAWWGEVHVAVHKGLGVLGCLTNGSMRDLDEVDGGFQILAGLISPSHGHVHVTSVNEPVEVLGLRVTPGDLIHADRHGAVRIAPAVAEALPSAIDAVHKDEEPLITAARRPDFDIETLLSIVDPPA